ncbi:peptidoglycan-binding protein [Candidatus Peregrinibacteria bacterium]|nr:MAG: peptidoglycan-binding protein [Candidatus Peregrinibacteria bacterium]
MNDQGDDVAALQAILIDQGYLEAGLNTGYFGLQTQKALIQFQVNQSIIPYETAPGAGRVGPATLSALNRI